MRFNLIKEPDSNPTDLLNSYRQQNILMQKIRILHTAFDGIKLNNWSDSNRELPNILIGSVCEFGGRLFEANDNIVLTDKNGSDGERFIRLEIVRDNQNSESDYLIAEVVNSGMPEYDYENRGFYSKANGVLKYKYLRVSMKYSKSSSGYVEKKYWNISDLMRAGITFKKHSVSLGVGTHNFNMPDNASSVTIHIVSGGGGGSQGLGRDAGTNGQQGGASTISINGKVITTCSGGTGGGWIQLKPTPQSGGIAWGQGKLINGIKASGKEGAIFSNNITLASGGNGGNGAANTLNAFGGSSGSAAIVEVTRAMLGGSKNITIVVGDGGNGGTNTNGANGYKGQGGSAVVEYMTRG